MAAFEDEFWVMDNSGFVSGPYDSQHEAEEEANDCTNPEGDFNSAGNLCVVKIIRTYDNHEYISPTPNWDELDDDDKEDLSEWFNVSIENIDDEDKERLAELFNEGRFEAFECENDDCDTKVFIAQPDDWDWCQGVQQADFTSYPVSPEQPEAERWCDHCRCYHQKH